MLDNSNGLRQLTLFWRYAIAAAVVWTAVIGGSLLWNYLLLDRQAEELLHNAAISNFNKDQAFRNWGTKHGGLYAPVTEETPPSPSMAHMPERDIETPSGKKLTLMNPAYMLRQLMEEYSDLYDIKGKITGLVLLRPENAPDAWERQALLKLKAGAEEVLEHSEIDGVPYLRMMRPMYMLPGCDKCHGHLGFKTGDFRGGVSISVPATPYILARNESFGVLAVTHFIGWLLGLGGIGLAGRRVSHHMGESRRAERALRESEGRYRGVLMSAADSIILIDQQGVIETINPAAEKLFGYDVSELVGQSVEKIMPESDRSAHANSIENYLKTGKGNVIGADARALSGMHKDGHEVPIELSINSLRIGQRQLFVGIIRDVAERTKEREALKNSEASLINAQRLARLGNWDWNIKTGTIVWSDGIYRIFGLEADKFLPTYEAFVQSIHPEDRDAVTAAVDATVKDGAPYSIRHRIVRPSGEIRVVHEEGEVIRGQAGEPLFMTGAAQDVTEQVEAEDALMLSKEQLHQAQKMEAVGQLTGGIAHDFNNLLAVILGNAEMAMERLDEDQDVQVLVDRIIQAGTRGADLTQRLLAFSRQQVLAPAVVDLNEILKDTAGLLGRAIGAHVEITSTLDAGLWRCLADRSQLENAILNLALNARDAMPGGGKLMIETANVALDDDYAAAQVEVTPGEYVLLSVSDTGEGILPEHQKLIFEPFFTTKKVGEGSGLGLSMIYGFVKQSGGHMTVYSEVGEGTTFKIYLPRTQEELTRRVLSQTEEDDQPTREATILVVEDDPDVRTLAVALLSDMGYEVLEARSGPVALALLEQGQHIDLLLSDVILPGGMSGPDLAARLAQERPGVPVLFMSGYAEQTMADTNRLDGAEAFLQKPFRKKDLAAKVHEALNGKTD